MIGTLDARPKVGYVYCGKSSSGLVYQQISKIKVS